MQPLLLYIFIKILSCVKQPRLLEFSIISILSLEIVSSLSSLYTIVIRSDNHTVHIIASVENNLCTITCVIQSSLQTICISLYTEATTNYAISLQTFTRYQLYLFFTNSTYCNWSSRSCCYRSCYYRSCRWSFFCYWSFSQFLLLSFLLSLLIRAFA